LPKITD